MTKTTGLLALLATLGFAAAANAQGTAPSTPLSIEIRGGAALPMGDLSDDDEGGAETGYTFGANATFQATPMLGIYAGWTRSSFGVEDAEDVSIRDQGFEAGVKAMFGGGTMPVSPFVKGGVLFHTLSVAGEGEGVEAEVESDNAIGFEVGGGVAIPLGQRMSVTPALTYSKFSTDEEDEFFGEVNVSGLRLDIGLNFRI